MTKPIRHGVVLVAGGAIGGGMFALPIVAAGGGYVWAAMALCLVWFFTYQASLMLLKVNLAFAVGASFSSIVVGILGPGWARINNLCIAFIMFILMYAYTTAGASILSHSLKGIGSSVEFLSEPASRQTLSLVFTAFIALLIWAGSTSVSRISTLFLIVMVLLLVVVLFDLSSLLNWQNLAPELEYLPFTANAIPVFVTALACGGLVPTLVKHYEADATKIRQCLLYGTILSLAVYLLWLLFTLGAVSREAYLAIITAGGNTGDLVSGLVSAGATDTLNRSLTVFSHLAIITSFLSVGLGLFDFVLDRFKLNDIFGGRSIAALICFLPPAILSYFYPYGFISAIAYAGLAVSFSFFVLPALMLMRQNQNQSHKYKSTQWLLRLILPMMFFGVAVFLLKILSELGVLSRFS